MVVHDISHPVVGWKCGRCDYFRAGSLIETEDGTEVPERWFMDDFMDHLMDCWDDPAWENVDPATCYVRHLPDES